MLRAYRLGSAVRANRPRLKVAHRSMVKDAPRPTLAVLLISQDQCWHDAAAAAVNALGTGRVDMVGDPAAALRALIAAGDGYSHLLVDMALAAGWLDLLGGLTAGETGTGISLVRLGPGGQAPGNAPLVPTPDVPLLIQALTAASVPPPRPLTRLEIVTALEQGQVTCRFQPIVRMADRRPVGLEVLARLDHAVHGSLPPSMFIPQLERLGHSLALADAVFQSCLSLVGAEFLGANGLFLSVNLPLDALLLPETLARIDARRAAAGMPAARLLIELTESRPVQDIPVLAAALERWRALGYRLAIDDMGPDMMNQAGLFDMAFHAVKLDKQIVLRSRADALARRYLQRTVALAQSRSLNVIAEGIEDQVMWDRMAEMGVDQAQGFLIARALPAAALPAWLDHWNGR